MTPKRVLVTGSAGRLGRAAVAGLMARGHIVTGFDVRPTPGLPDRQSFVAGLGETRILRNAATGVDSIIHLAATPDDARFPRGGPPDDGDNFLNELVPNNLVGPYQILEVARSLKIPRVILASTGQVVDGYEGEGRYPIAPDVPARPRYIYACTKVFLEALGQVYARRHGICIVAVRLGWCPRDAGQVGEIRASERGQDVYLSPGDAGRFFAATVEAKELPEYSVVFATSRFVHKHRYDLSNCKDLFGWEPQEQWPQGTEA
jgi:uronate dehydrogenase